LLSLGFVESEKSNFGQILLAYYSGVGADTVGSGGINGISMAFFSPSAMAGQSCNFNDPQTPCLRPATGAGGSLGLAWALNTINDTRTLLSKNTSPSRGGNPTIFFSFGGQSEGGAGWDSIFQNAGQAKTFGQNCAKLVQTVSAVSHGAYIGIDLDIEGTQTSLPQFSSFISAFRSSASASQYPLMLDSLSGLADSSSGDHFKLDIMKNYGPQQGGVTFLNMMVTNQQSSCSDMSKFWRDSRLDFIPPGNKILGFWGENLAAWILKNPGCTDGSDPLYSWMKSNGVGMGIWQWWIGSTNDITPVINQVRSG